MVKLSIVPRTARTRSKGWSTSCVLKTKSVRMKWIVARSHYHCPRANVIWPAQKGSNICFFNSQVYYKPGKEKTLWLFVCEWWNAGISCHQSIPFTLTVRAHLESTAYYVRDRVIMTGVTPRFGQRHGKDFRAKMTGIFQLKTFFTTKSFAYAAKLVAQAYFGPS